MDSKTLAIAVTVGFSVMGVIGDYFLKLATISVLYSVSLILLLTAIGIVFFHESLTAYEIVGLIMALGSLILLIRFA